MESATLSSGRIVRLGFLAVALSLLCIDTAQAHVAQSNTTFALTAQQCGFCRIGTDSTPVTASLNAQGSINGSQVTFGDSGCPYTGTVAAARASFHEPSADPVDGPIVDTVNQQLTPCSSAC